MNELENIFQELNIVCSSIQNKKWRKSCLWYKGGKRNECEKYQLTTLLKITKEPIKTKTDLRFNILTYSFDKVKNPNTKDNGFEYTEDIDGIQKIGDYTLYYNLKMICNKGGAQTRTLREVYHFIRCQLEYLLIRTCDLDNNCITSYFVNILDGDESFRNINKFKNLINKERYNKIKKYVYIGDLKQYIELWKKSNGNINQLINN